MSVEQVRRVRESLHQAVAAPAEPIPLGDGLTTADLAAEAAAMAAERMEARWRLVCPARFVHATLDWVRAEHGARSADLLDGWAADPAGRNLLLFGAIGTGKTSAALAACKPGQLAGQGVAFYPVSELLDLLRPGGPDDAMAHLQAAPRLIIDDLGTERATDWTAERLGVLVNRRWMEERPVVATTNLTPEQLAAVVGERTYSRLVGGAVTVLLAGDDRRRRKHAASA